MFCSKPLTEVIRQRFSCRRYFEKPISEGERKQLSDFLSAERKGPLGTPVRFEIVAATEEDRNSLKGLGTYGVIKGATGFIIGAAGPSEKNLEEFGYMMERCILYATDMGLGTCWLGGTFTRSRFAKKISIKTEETVPAVTSIGYIAERGKYEGKMRQIVDADNRKPWESLFFREKFGIPLARDEAGAYAVPLDMVRMGPSATNKQPWRIISDNGGKSWHFYLHRNKGYGNGFAFKILRLADLQRVDMGIAMSHFEMTAEEHGLKGTWIIKEPKIEKPDKMIEYTISWVSSE